MESKKPLILIPPMSEPMAKLKEILEGLAAEENIEIYTVDNVKEFAQLVGSGGQALVMMSNAKVCATLLQETKAIIAKNHTKVILLTPKEIPQKTLIKFTKIGLTEAILENSPPKTLLYKVKLLLRSIKAVQKEENNQQLVKSMLDTNPRTKIADEMHLDTEAKVSEINPDAPEEETKKKMIAADSEKLDYLTNMKGKKSTQEEAIETHWKSSKEKSTKLDLDESDSMKSKSNEAIEDIDMYYRGKRKKDSLDIENPEEETTDKKRRQELEEAEDYSLKKKNEEIVEEADVEKKRKTFAVEEEEESLIQKAIKEEIEAIEKERKKSTQLESEEEPELTQEKVESEFEINDNLDEDKEKKEDLGGYLKGKITKQESLEEAAEEYKEKTEEIESIEAERKKKTQALEETEEAYTKDKKREEISDEDDPHEGEVDKIDSFMRGDLDSTEAIKTRMESESKKKEKELESSDADDFDKKKENNLNLEEEDFREKKALIEESDLLSKDLKREKLVDEDNIKDFKKEAGIRSDEDDSDYERREADKLKKAEHERDASTNLDIESADLDHSRSSNKEDDGYNRRDVNNNGLDLEKGDGSHTHEGKTDKISTYYKTGESKDKDQDWNLAQERKNTTLDIQKTKKEDIDLGQLKKIHTGETTIDYRKLKEEFEQISRGEIDSTSNSEGKFDANGKRVIDAENNFKVIEVGKTSFDFAIEIVNLIYSQETKPNQILKTISEKILKDNNGLMVAYHYHLKEKKYNDIFNSYNEFNSQIDDVAKSLWDEIKNNDSNKELFTTLSMPTWICRTIPDNGSFWRDSELPTWANNELVNKPVELLYPYFDGVDRMGYIHVLFSNGIKPENEKNIQIALDMARTVFLDIIQRKKNESVETTPTDSKPPEEENKGKVLNFLSGFLGKKKAS